MIGRALRETPAPARATSARSSAPTSSARRPPESAAASPAGGSASSRRTIRHTGVAGFARVRRSARTRTGALDSAALAIGVAACRVGRAKTGRAPGRSTRNDRASASWSRRSAGGEASRTRGRATVGSGPTTRSSAESPTARAGSAAGCAWVGGCRAAGCGWDAGVEAGAAAGAGCTDGAATTGASAGAGAATGAGAGAGAGAGSARGGAGAGGALRAGRNASGSR
jgi:hypothetical protein